MGFKNLETFRAFLKRSSERGRKRGRELERWVADVLEEMVALGFLDRFTRHEPNSKADRSGKDFTVVRDSEEKSFGVTISCGRKDESALRYPNIPQWYLPAETSAKRVMEKVLGLFGKAHILDRPPQDIAERMGDVTPEQEQEWWLTPNSDLEYLKPRESYLFGDEESRKRVQELALEVG